MSNAIDFNNNFHSFIYENVARLPFQSIMAAHNVFWEGEKGILEGGENDKQKHNACILLAVSTLESGIAVKGNQRPQWSLGIIDLPPNPAFNN